MATGGCRRTKSGISSRGDQFDVAMTQISRWTKRKKFRWRCRRANEVALILATMAEDDAKPAAAAAAAAADDDDSDVEMSGECEYNAVGTHRRMRHMTCKVSLPDGHCAKICGRAEGSA